MTNVCFEPLPHGEVRVLIDGAERTRWHFHDDAPGPFFHPVVGPGGASLTRMGHPGAPDHDHHRSVWLAHNDVSGVDFWTMGRPARIRQTGWLCYQDAGEVDGVPEGVLAASLAWLDGHDPAPLLRSTLVAAIQPDESPGAWFLELQVSLEPTAKTFEFGRTNFGFVAVRVAKAISERFGGGRLTGADGATGEPALFGQAHPWMDYSGPNPATTLTPGGPDVPERAGLTLFDHPSNPGQPTKWHVRSDGWMGPSVCRDAPLTLAGGASATLRYLLHVHAGDLVPDRAAALAAEFAASRPWEVVRSTRTHTRHEARRTAG